MTKKIAVNSAIICGLLLIQFTAAIANPELVNSTNGLNMIKQLPKPTFDNLFSIDKAISKRRSTRQFSSKTLSEDQISKLLWSAQGITDLAQHFRAAPSAGALYPIKIYVVTQDGSFVYDPEKHVLKSTSKKDLRQALSEAALGQKPIKKAPLNIVIVAEYQITTSKYGERGIRYVHIETGHIAQNIALEAVALGLSSLTIGAFDDKTVSTILNLSNNQTPLYIIPIGYSMPSLFRFSVLNTFS